MARPVVLLDGRTVSCAQVADVARGIAVAAVSDESIERAQAAAHTAREVATRREVYGRTTGVGANRDQPVSAQDLETHGLRLLRSHASGIGPLVPADASRAMLVVRANQIGAGGSGVDPGVLGPLLEGVNAGLFVPVPRYGAIGTGDLTALAVAALCMLGERQWVPAEAVSTGSSAAAALPAGLVRCAGVPVKQRRDRRRVRARLYRSRRTAQGG